MTEELKQLREALRRVKHEAASLADAQVIALEALTQRPAAQAGEVELAFDQGWRMAAEWANRDDLIPDMDSPHYAKERSDRLASLPTQPAAQEMPDAVEHYGTVDDLPAAQATPEPDDAQRRFEAGCVVLEYLRDIGAPYRAVHHMLIALHGDPEAKSKATPEPVGEAPIWNSIQIASWIGSQLMHEPAMFERATVCKFVRSLGRHATLLKHSPQANASNSSQP